MATIRIHFPENETPTLLNLNGAFITLGRLPHNTIQIVDRTISALHAEFIREGDHYRLHDRGSSNGTFVNGEAITDYHLKNACRISFGSFECEFSPAIAPAAPDESNESLPSRGEINEVRHDNVKLRNQVELLREEVETLSKVRPAEGGATQEVVPKEEFIRIVGELEKSKQSLLQSGNEMAGLKNTLAILQRDRANLQRGLDDAKAELAKNKINVSHAVSAEAASPKASESRAPEAVKIETQAPAESEPEIPKMPKAPAFKSLPKPFVPPGMQPAHAPAPTAAVDQPLPLAPTNAAPKVQPGSGSGIRPYAKGNPPTPQSKPGLAVDTPMAPGARAVAKPIARPTPRASVAAGPKGTQKLT